MVLLDNQGNSFPVYQEEPGIYVLPEGSAQIFPGNSYSLEVELRDQTYKTPFQRMGEKSAKDSISYRIEDFAEFNEFGNEVISRVYNVYLDSHFENLGESQYLKWEAREVYVIDTKDQLDDCYREQKADPQRINIQEAEGGLQILATDELIARRPFNDAFGLKYYTIVDQLNISRDEYDYWKKVKSGIEQVGSILDIPPGRIRGNFTSTTNPEEIVYGYFSVALKTSTRFSIKRSELSEVPAKLCKSNLSIFNLPIFCQCLDGILKPDYF